ncbi:MAG: oligopeptidase A [Sulfuricaulis sp.]|uniref:oligopeptidase A n=1 Tax=Sulfuricaulis sp. TaxID=2003553 RepID=UPI0025CCD944|nr:oligopeptidase A [Sulfuricaulis sp.]MCR4346335.1 oligopeptidase A [Sulfuricaulis sp.]
MENTFLVNNPLLDLTQPPRFGAILPEHAGPALDHVLAENRAALERVLKADGPHTWDNFAQPIEDMRERLVRLWSPVSHLHAVMDSEALRAAYNAGLPKLTDYFTDLAQDERLYTGYKSIAASPEFSRLTQAQKKIIENTLRDFRLAGAELLPMEKARFKVVQQEIAALHSKFSENVLDATQAWDLRITDAKDLTGLPESARAMAQQDALEKKLTGWRFTLEAPSYIAFMTYADDRERRRQMYEAFVTRASDQGPTAGRWDNSELILRLLRRRREAAQLLGFNNFAEYALQTRMAKKVPEVLDFLNDLAQRAKSAAQKDFDELRHFARDAHGVERLEAWDIAYYSEKLQQAKYQLSQEDLRPYFPETRVVPGMFEVVERLYGLKVTEVKGVEVWHPDVRFYEIRDGAGEVRGRFYMDLYARASKRGGAWMDECINRKRTANGIQVPVAYLVCNFTPPVGGRPALFTHDEVITLFHEFGHGLHHMLTRVDYVGVAGINGVAWDAVELPSQFMENWCWEREALDLVAAHHQSGEKIPDDLYTKMIAAKNFLSGMQFVRQLEFSMFDMRLHSTFSPDGSKSVQQVLDEVRAEVAVIIPPAFSRFQNGFSHIFAGGYAAGYYSYKWAEVLSADAFSKFEENGVFDRATGLQFLQNILEQGGSREPMELFVQFRGRAPKIDALLRHSGLAA